MLELNCFKCYTISMHALCANGTQFMLKNSLVALLAVAGGLAGQSAMAAPAAAATHATCDAPVITVASAASKAAHFSVECQLPNFLTVTPQVVFKGEVPAAGKAPYQLKASYTVDVRSDNARKLAVLPREDQEALGRLVSATDSIAVLGAQFAQQTAWDPAGVISIEDSPGKWRVYSLQADATTDRADSGAAAEVSLGVVNAGVADTPFKQGRAVVNVELGETVSRFAGKTAEDLPSVKLAMGLREGSLEVLEGASRVINQEALQNAILRLDRAPKDMARAWAVAARAKILGLDNEARYAEQKVAAHSPQLLSEFQENLKRIKPFNAKQN